ncbi:MFS transporter [Rhodococcus qingshengii]|uniref:MFS transporter n=1 Tax=Rhodococcus qingshengii TaxID=334542 RepID=UPI001F1410B3|nr:MFS transporter [Rhodococcus qingshengii]ULD45140.1 MFS transporter [Rhodococcus qingshengii]
MALTFSGLQLLGEVGALMVIPLYSSMSVELGLSASQVSWALTSTLLMGAVSTALLAKIGDLFGHRQVILMCTATVILGYVISALSTNFETLLVGRALTGIVATQALYIGIMNDRLTAADRNKAVGILAGGQAVGVTLGFGLGGVLIALGATWRTAFWIGALLTVGGLIAMYAWGSDSDAKERSGSKPKSINVIGLLVLGVSLTLLCVGIGQSTSWGILSVKTLTCVLLGVGGIAAGLYQESRSANPLVDTSLVGSSRVLPVFGAFVAIGIVGIMMLNFVMGWAQTPIEIGYGFGFSPLIAGLLFVPMTVSGIVAGKYVPRVLRRTRAKTPLGVSAVCLSLSCLFMYFAHSSVVGTMFGIFFYGLSFSALLTTAISVIASQAPQESGAGTASIYVSVSLASSSLGTAIYAAIMGLNPTAEGMVPAVNYSIGFLAAAVVGLVAVAAAAFLSKAVSLSTEDTVVAH